MWFLCKNGKINLVVEVRLVITIGVGVTERKHEGYSRVFLDLYLLHECKFIK